jgi:altronate dehydratase
MSRPTILGYVRPDGRAGFREFMIHRIILSF